MCFLVIFASDCPSLAKRGNSRRDSCIKEMRWASLFHKRKACPLRANRKQHFPYPHRSGLHKSPTRCDVSFYPWLFKKETYENKMA